jgi:hypothetical protein
MIPATAYHYLLALEAAAPMKLTGIAVKGIRKTKDGKIAKLDKAPTHVKQKRRRTKGKVTGARAAK